jgi:hypothetical protein
MRKLPILLFAVSCLASGAAFAQSYDESVTDSPGGDVVRHVYNNGPFKRAESDVYGPYGRHCHISSFGVRTYYGMRSRTRRRCN